MEGGNNCAVSSRDTGQLSPSLSSPKLLSIFLSPSPIFGETNDSKLLLEISILSLRSDLTFTSVK